MLLWLCPFWFCLSRRNTYHFDDAFATNQDNNAANDGDQETKYATTEQLRMADKGDSNSKDNFLYNSLAYYDDDWFVSSIEEDVPDEVEFIKREVKQFQKEKGCPLLSEHENYNLLLQMVED